MIYLDHAATTPLRKEALDAMMPFFTEKAANASALYAAGRQTRSAIDAARRQIAQAIGAHEREIYFTAGGSEADNWALFGIARTMKEKRHIITTQIEHHAVLNSCAALEQMGYPVTYIEPDEYGFISPEKVKAAMRPDTGLVSVMTANNEVGTIEPIAEIAKIAHENGALIHTDAVQAVGHIPVNVKKQNIDLLSLSAHKFHGPRGIGVLYARRGMELRSLMEGGGQERGKRPGTENVPAIMGMAAALKEECVLMEENTRKISAMRDRLIQGLSKIPHCILNGPAGNRLPGNVNFCFEGVSGESLLLLLDSKGICASSGSACASGALDPSHVLLALGRSPEIAQGSLRLSLDASNTEEEVDYMLEVIPQVVEHLRRMSADWQEKVKGSREFEL